jgi:hypothetical protein
MTETTTINDATGRKPLEFVKRKGLMYKIIPLLFVLGGVVGFMRLFELSEITYKVLQFGSIAAQFFLIGQAFWYSFRVSYTDKVVEIVTRRFKRRSIISFKTIKEVALKDDLLIVDCGYNNEHKIKMSYVTEESQLELLEFMKAQMIRIKK